MSRNVLITGVSRGIGHALARRLLQTGHHVWGVSRGIPADLLAHPEFRHMRADLADGEPSAESIVDWLARENEVTSLRYLFLNAGQFSQRIANLRDVSLRSIQYIMDLNVWSNKLILDNLLHAGVRIDTCVVSSSIAGVRARAGNSAYALSKATLNMLMRQYALEQPETFFAVLGLCNVTTHLSHQIGTLPLEGHFPEIEGLRTRGAASGYLVTAEERAGHIIALLEQGIGSRVNSGEFVEIRQLLKHAAESPPASSQPVSIHEGQS